MLTFVMLPINLLSYSYFLVRLILKQCRSIDNGFAQKTKGTGYHNK